MLRRNCATDIGGFVFFISLLFSSATVLAETVEEYLQDAKAYLEQGKLNAAIIQFKNAVKEDPKHGEARFSLGQAYLLSGDVNGAEKELKRAQRLGVDEERIVPLLGQAYLLQKDTDKVLNEMQIKDGMSASLKTTIHELRGQSYLILGDKAKSQKEYDAALGLDPMASGALLGKARLALMGGDMDGALKLVKSVTDKDEKNAEAWALGGELLRQKGDMAAAGEFFEKAILAQSRHIPARLGLATTQIALGKMDDAKASIEGILKLVPNSPHANHLKALILVAEGDLDKAEELLQGVLRVLPDYPPAQQLMASVHFSKGQYEQAEYLLSRIINTAPNNVSAVKLLAATYVKLRQGKKAITLLESVQPGLENDAQFLALLGSAYLQEKDLEKGMDYLEKAAAAAPDTAAIHTQLALGRLASGDTTAAVKELEAAVDLGQNIFQADILLTMVHLKKKEFDKALAQAKAFSKKLPNSPLPYNLMGAAFVGLKQLDKAKESFEEALKVEPAFSPAAMNLASLSEQRGDISKAKQRYEKVLKNDPAHEGAYLALARLAGQSGENERMRDLLETSWEKNNGSIKSGVALIGYYNQTKQHLRAVSVAREMKNKHPKQAIAYRALGDSQMQAKDFHSAKGTYESWVSMDEASPEARFFLGQAERALGEKKDAKASFEKSLQIAPDFLPPKLGLATIYMGDKEFKPALEMALTIQKERPNESAGYRLEGDIYLQMKEYKKAEHAYAKGLKKAPATLLALGEYQARKMAGEKTAYKSLEEWLKNNDKDTKARTVLAGAYQQAGVLVKAEAEYRKLLLESGNNVVILNNLAWVAAELKKPDALELARMAYDLAPENPAVMDTYGWLLVKSQDARKGVNILQQAVALAPHLAEIRYHFGVALHRVGRNKEAKSELSRALEMSQMFNGAKDAKALLRKI